MGWSSAKPSEPETGSPTMLVTFDDPSRHPVCVEIDAAAAFHGDHWSVDHHRSGTDCLGTIALAAERSCRLSTRWADTHERDVA